MPVEADRKRSDAGRILDLGAHETQWRRWAVRRDLAPQNRKYV